MGKGISAPKLVVLPRPLAKREMTHAEAIAHISKHQPLTKTGKDLAKDLGWEVRRTQKWIQRMIKRGKLLKRGKALTVIPDAAHAPRPSAQEIERTNARVRYGRMALTVLVLGVVAYLNAWPRMAALLRGESDSGGWAFLAFQLLVLFVMSQIPFAISRQGRNLPAKLGLGAFAFILVVINVAFSVESVGLVRDAARDRNRAAEEKVASIRRQLDETRDAKARLPTFTPTTAEAVTSAQQAVASATIAREQECGKVGENCRKRVEELKAAGDKLEALQAGKAATDQDFALGIKISALENDLRQAGPAPLAVDPGAARLAALTMGLATPAVVSEWLPTLMSLVAELLALFGPYALAGALFGKEERP